MLDIGWSELLVIAVVLIVVVGPKDLPPMLRAFGKMTSRLRKTAGEFRAQFDEALREADMDEVRQTIADAQRFNPANSLREAINPLRQMGEDIKSDLRAATAVPSESRIPSADEGPAEMPSPFPDSFPNGPSKSTADPGSAVLTSTPDELLSAPGESAASSPAAPPSQPVAAPPAPVAASVSAAAHAGAGAPATAAPAGTPAAAGTPAGAAVAAPAVAVAVASRPRKARTKPVVDDAETKAESGSIDAALKPKSPRKPRVATAPVETAAVAKAPKPRLPRKTTKPKEES